MHRKPFAPIVRGLCQRLQSMPVQSLGWSTSALALILSSTMAAPSLEATHIYWRGVGVEADAAPVSGNWSQESAWSDSINGVANRNAPGSLDTAILANGVSVEANNAIAVSAIGVQNPGSVLTLSEGTVTSQSVIASTHNSILHISGGHVTTPYLPIDDRSLVHISHGTVNVHGRIEVHGNAQLHLSGGTLTVQDTLFLGQWASGAHFILSGTGLLHLKKNGTTPEIRLGTTTARAENQTYRMTLGGAPVLNAMGLPAPTPEKTAAAAGRIQIVEPDGTLSAEKPIIRFVFPNTSNAQIRAVDFNHTATVNHPYLFDADLRTEGDGRPQINFYAGYTELAGLANHGFASDGTVYDGATAVFTQDYGQTDLSVLSGGTVRGTGAIARLNSQGTTAPGTSQNLGTLNVRGDAIFADTHQLICRIAPQADTADAALSQSDRIVMGGNGALAGKLVIQPVTVGAAFDPQKTYRFKVIEANTADNGSKLTGNFAVVSATDNQYHVTYQPSDQSGIVEVRYTPSSLNAGMPKQIPPSTDFLPLTRVPPAGSPAAQVLSRLMQRQGEPGVAALLAAIGQLSSAAEVKRALEDLTAHHNTSGAEISLSETVLDQTASVLEFVQDPEDEHAHSFSIPLRHNNLIPHTPVSCLSQEQVAVGILRPVENLRINLGKGAVWLSTLGSHSKTASDTHENGRNIPGAQMLSAGSTLGFHYAWAPSWTTGFFGRYQYNDIQFLDTSRRSYAHGLGLGAHLSYRPVPAGYISAVFAYDTAQRYGKRDLEIAAAGEEALFSQTLHHQARIATYTGLLETGYSFKLPHHLVLKPYVGAGWFSQDQDAYHESARQEKGLSLDISGRSSQFLQGRAGMHLIYQYSGQCMDSRTFMHLGYKHLHKMNATGSSSHQNKTQQSLHLGCGGEVVGKNGLYTRTAIDFQLTGMTRSQSLMLKIGKRF